MPKKGDPAGVRVLAAADVDALISPAECVDVVEDAFRRWAMGDAGDPQALSIHVSSGMFNIKAAALQVGNRSYFAAKTNGNFPGNRERRALPSIQGAIVLSDGESGTPLAVMDSIRITELRTAAATAVAAKYLARPDASTLTMIGCGAQARSHLEALRGVRSLSRVTLLDRNRSRAERLAEWATEKLALPVIVLRGPDAGLPDSDIIVTCTTATQPVLMADMVRPGTFVAAVGADSPSKHEIDAALLGASKVVVDSIEQCAAMGELHHALEAGIMREEDVHAELGHVVGRLRAGRESPTEIIVFDSTGLALQDVAAAALVYERAIAAGRGVQVELGPAAS
jgi:alanine dehydrogenase